LQDFEQAGIACNEWITPIVRGAVEIRTVYVGTTLAKIGKGFAVWLMVEVGNVFAAGVVSRISCARTGSRFLTRGIDDQGNVASAVETEQAG
jgi:hypothetical protein